MAVLGVRSGFKMILSHRAPSSFNMSSYRAIWTHFRSNFMIFLQKMSWTWSWTLDLNLVQVLVQVLDLDLDQVLDQDLDQDQNIVL